MRKPKATVRSLREDLKNLQAKFEVFKTNVRAYVLNINNSSNRRPLMTIEPANEKGMINGLTIPELVMLVNLNNSTGEQTVLETTDGKKNLLVIAKKQMPCIPFELL